MLKDIEKFYIKLLMKGLRKLDLRLKDRQLIIRFRLFDRLQWEQSQSQQQTT